jgi:pyridoxamine 5'-phosphate oxidase
MALNEQEIRNIRTDYTRHSLDEKDVASNPLEQFQKWMQEAMQSAVHEPNAMHLATVTADGRPAGRVVLLRGLDADGFSFFTNYNSNKGMQLEKSGYAALTFFWPELERQIRIEGSVSQLTDKENDEYFYSRPRGNRLGAWASPQSQPIANREVLEKLAQVLEAKYPDPMPIPRPEHWGGFKLAPDSIEFWQGRASRLHDRIRYRKEQETWVIERLAP